MPKPIGRPSTQPITTPKAPAAAPPSTPAATQSTGWSPANRASAAPPVYRSPVADGRLAVPFKLELDGKQVEATLVGTVVSLVGSSEGVGYSRPITVQSLTDPHVEVGGKRLDIADDALATLMKQRGLEPDWPYSSPTEVSSAGLFGLKGAKSMVTVDGTTFRMTRRDEEKRFHSGEVALHHPERLY